MWPDGCRFKSLLFRVIRNLGLYSVLLFITLSSWWLLEQQQSEEVVPIKLEGHSADYFSEGYKKVEMDGMGNPVSILEAKTLTHFKDDQTTELAQCKITFFNSDGSSWIIQADAAVLWANGNDLFLNGVVHINRAPVEGVRPVQINTSDLRVKLDQSYAETDNWAEIITPPDRTEGTGLQMIYSKPIQLELMHTVKGRYEMQ
ncbi:MAG: LPS export ABC transporter periplasmic protein LptC [Methylococcales bacterium]|nr:LPS export ABC transporter periplasmic protein LptC [Methylococcales bacterium]